MYLAGNKHQYWAYLRLPRVLRVRRIWQHFIEWEQELGSKYISHSDRSID